MRFCIVGRVFQSLSACSRAGGLTQNVGRREPVRRRSVASAKTNRIPSAGMRFLLGASKTSNFGVCTMCTLWPSDCVVLGLDRGRIPHVSAEAQ